jgi:drug/metabolite transporter (DMT)-like permease
MDNSRDLNKTEQRSIETQTTIQLQECEKNTTASATQAAETSDEALDSLLHDQKLEEKPPLSKWRVDKLVYSHIKPIEGYFFGIMFAFSMCTMNLFVKMAPALDGSNHALVRYTIQFIILVSLIKYYRVSFFGPREQRMLLVLRGVVGALAVIIGFFSVRYMDVSDVETLTNSALIITALISRIFLKERLTVTHIVALVLTIAGVVFIIRPSFLFGIEHDIKNIFVKPPVKIEVNSTVLTTTMATTSMLLQNSTIGFNMTTRAEMRTVRSLIDKQKAHIKDHSNREFIETCLGVTLVLMSAVCQSIAQVVIRKLCLVKVHYAVNSMYPALIGLPMSMFVSGLFYQFKWIKYEEYATSDILVQVGYSVCGGVMGTFGLIFLNLALKFEDATKIGMVKTNVGIFLAFILQYIVLDIEVDSFGALGALFVISATLSVMLLKLFDKRIAESKNSCVRFFTQKF